MVLNRQILCYLISLKIKLIPISFGSVCMVCTRMVTTDFSYVSSYSPLDILRNWIQSNVRVYFNFILKYVPLTVNEIVTISVFNATYHNIANEFPTNSCEHFKHCDCQLWLDWQTILKSIFTQRPKIYIWTCLFICLLIFFVVVAIGMHELKQYKLRYIYNGSHHSSQFYLKRNKMRFFFSRALINCTHRYTMP